LGLALKKLRCGLRGLSISRIVQRATGQKKLCFGVGKERFIAVLQGKLIENEITLDRGASLAMGNLKILILGVGVAGLGIFGTYNAINSFGEAPEEKSDITTTGTVTHLTATELRHQLGVTIDTTYKMQYSFQAADGETYRGEENLEKAEIARLAKGSQIKVMYHSNNPDVNGAPEYGFYLSANAISDSTPQFKLGFSLGFFALGALIIVYAVKFGDEQPATGYPCQA
jgi:hypothetical protein